MPDGGTAQYDVLRDSSVEPVVPLQTMAPSFSPAVAGAVPKISVVFDVDSTSLPKLELAALTVGFLNKLQVESDETFDRTKIVVELSRGCWPGPVSCCSELTRFNFESVFDKD